VPDYGIDLPVVSGDLDVAGNDDDFPLCDVGQYLTSYVQPGEPGAVYIYAHARNGMFLPLLEASQREDGAELIGRDVLVFTSDAMLYRYRIAAVKRHALDFALADDVSLGERRLILQTSEGLRGTPEKLQIAASLLSVEPSTLDESVPSPHPRPCG
jgi:hypothetical protein